MSTVSAAVDVSSIDWKIIAGAIGTFAATVYMTLQGLKKGRRNVESGRSELTPIVGATLMETTSMFQLAESLKENTEELRNNTAELRRSNDIEIMRSKR